jgi:hypothetical protein
MKRSALFYFAAFAGCVAAVCAGETMSPDVGLGARLRQDLNPSGVVRLDYFRSSKTLDSETDFLGVTAQLKLLPTLGRSVDAKVEVRVSSPPIDKGGDTDIRLLEGYATKHFAKADLRLGRQIVAWGRADGINPTDNLTPRDYVTLLPFEDDQRFGTTALKLDTFLTPNFTLSAFATPIFEPHKIPFPSGSGTFVKELPARSFSNAEFGVKLDKVGEGFDWSLSFYRGFNLLPNLRLVRATDGAQIIKARYDRIRVFGADFARNLGRFGFRGEIAYVDTSGNHGTSQEAINPNLFFIVGVDRTFFEHLNLNLQYFRRQVCHYRDPYSIADLAARDVAIQSSILTGHRDHVSDGISFRVSNKWLHDTLEAEIFGIVNLTSRDGFIRPSVTYAFTDHWKATIGGDFYHGARNTQFGGLKANRGAFVEARFGF